MATSSGASTSHQLIGNDGFNTQLLKDHAVEIRHPAEELVTEAEREFRDDTGNSVVEETTVIVLCEQDYHRGDINHAEATETRVHGELRGYVVYCPGGVWAVLQGEETSGSQDLRYTTVGFVTVLGDTTSDLRCIVVKGWKEMARLKAAPKDVSAEEIDSPHAPNSIKQEVKQEVPQETHLRKRAHSAITIGDDSSDSNSEDESEGSSLNAKRPPQKRVKRSSMVTSSARKGSGRRSQVGTQTPSAIPGSVGPSLAAVAGRRTVPTGSQRQNQMNSSQMQTGQKKDGNSFDTKGKAIAKNEKKLKTLKEETGRLQDEKLADQRRQIARMEAALASLQG